jgi:regulator of protease activity HflC (stomatin/prohibitin superfamily)
MALEALLNGYTLAGTLLLTRILSHHAERVATKLKATALRVVLLAIRDLGLHAVLPALEARLSGGTLSAMDEETRRLLTQIRSLGELHRHFVPPERIRESYERRLTKERRYLEKTHPGSDVSEDFDTLWRS